VGPVRMEMPVTINWPSPDKWAHRNVEIATEFDLGHIPIMPVSEDLASWLLEAVSELRWLWYELFRQHDSSRFRCR
jgi:hypothetical protein